MGLIRGWLNRNKFRDKYQFYILSLIKSIVAKTGDIEINKRDFELANSFRLNIERDNNKIYLSLRP